MSKELKHRAICPHCNTAFDSRQGSLYWGKLICPECMKKYLHYNTMNDYRKDLR